MKPESTTYRINCINKNKVCEPAAEDIQADRLFGFRRVSEILFYLKVAAVIDPKDEQPEVGFAEVDDLHEPLPHVLKVKQQKSCKIRPLHLQPMTIMTSQPGPLK